MSHLQSKAFTYLFEPCLKNYLNYQQSDDVLGHKALQKTKYGSENSDSKTNTQTADSVVKAFLQYR